MDLGSIRFARFQFVYVIAAALLVVPLVRALRQKKYLAHSITWDPILSRIHPSSIRIVPKGLMLAGVLSAAVCLMEPELRFHITETRLEGLDIVLIVDLSSSMQDL